MISVALVILSLTSISAFKLDSSAHVATTQQTIRRAQGVQCPINFDTSKGTFPYQTLDFGECERSKGFIKEDVADLPSGGPPFVCYRCSKEAGLTRSIKQECRFGVDCTNGICDDGAIECPPSTSGFCEDDCYCQCSVSGRFSIKQSRQAEDAGGMLCFYQTRWFHLCG